MFTNGSGSHHQLRKLNKRVDLIKLATSKVPYHTLTNITHHTRHQVGGVYMYSNLIGCDGERVYYDGCCLIAVNGEVLAQGSQFTLREVEVTTATIDLDDVRSFRGACLSRGMQSGRNVPYPRVYTSFSLSRPLSLSLPISRPLSVRYLMPEEEIRYILTPSHLHTLTPSQSGSPLLVVGLPQTQQPLRILSPSQWRPGQLQRRLPRGSCVNLSTKYPFV